MRDMFKISLQSEQKKSAPFSFSQLPNILCGNELMLVFRMSSLPARFIPHQISPYKPFIESMQRTQRCLLRIFPYFLRNCAANKAYRTMDFCVLCFKSLRPGIEFKNFDFLANCDFFLNLASGKRKKTYFFNS